MRYERKYRTEQLDYHTVLQMVRNHPMSFRTLHPDQQVNSIYFDTPELHFLHENLYGVAERRKYRIRWYGTNIAAAEQPVLEMKCKEGELGDKFTAALAPLDFSDVAQVRAQLVEGFRAVHAAHPLASTLGARELAPMLLNTYLRSYLISYDGKFRLTIDRAVRYHAFNARLQPLATACVDHAVVVEVKYDAADADDYQRVAQRLPLRLARNSKYTVGMLMVANV